MLQVKPGECKPFWPRSKDEKKEIRVRIEGTCEMSAPFSYSTVYTTMLKLGNKVHFTVLDMYHSNDVICFFASTQWFKVILHIN
jgi:hypothetical protein